MHFVFTKYSAAAWRERARSILWLSVVGALIAVTGCKKSVATEASDSDANGYLCTKCGAKIYTERSEFLASTCPKCRQEGLVEVVGYVCSKDKYVTVVGRSGERQGKNTCEKCG